MQENNLNIEFKKQLFFHAFIQNVDCHQKNISVLTNAQTHQIIELAPIYDMGTSFGCMLKINSYDNFSNTILKPFGYTPKEQIKYCILNEKVREHFENYLNEANIKEIKEIINSNYKIFGLSDMSISRAFKIIDQSYIFFQEALTELNYKEQNMYDKIRKNKKKDIENER